ncbi:hypothetical protein CHUAL_002823 [Chamberlinius hualienensis]
MLKSDAELEFATKRIVTTTPGHSTLEEITDQVEAIQGKPPEMPPMETEANATSTGETGNVLLVGEESKAESDKKSQLATRLWKARDRIYYLTRQCNRLKRRIFDLKLENRKMKRQASSVVQSLDGLKALPRRQQLIFEQAILQTQQKRGGMRYSPEWIADCIQLKIRSAAVYEYLRRNQYMPLPNPGTLYNFVKQRKVDVGISFQMLETLKDKGSTTTTTTLIEPSIIESPIMENSEIENDIIDHVDIEQSAMDETVIEHSVIENSEMMESAIIDHSIIMDSTVIEEAIIVTS